MFGDPQLDQRMRWRAIFRAANVVTCCAGLAMAEPASAAPREPAEQGSALWADQPGPPMSPNQTNDATCDRESLAAALSSFDDHQCHALKALQQQSPFRARLHAQAALHSLARVRELTGAEPQARDLLDRAIQIARQRESLDDWDESTPPERLQLVVEAHQVIDPAAGEYRGARVSDLKAAYGRRAGANLVAAFSDQPQAAQAIAIWAKAEAARSPDGQAGLWLMQIAAHLAPNDPVIASACGRSLVKSGRLSEARWHLERAVAQQPNEPALRALSEVYQRQGEVHLARDCERQLIAFAQRPNAPPIQLVTPAEFAAIFPEPSIVPIDTSGTRQEPSATAASTAKAVGWPTSWMWWR